MKKLVLAEKPSVGRDIGKVLKCTKKIGNGALEGDAYIVTWALGHLVELAPPEKYDVKFKEWKMETLPMVPDAWKLEVIGKTGKQYQMVKSQLFRKDVGEIVIATDAGREGELVARWILEKSKCKKPIKRLWISSVTDKAIREGFKKLEPGKNYENLYQAAQARAKADWVVGMNATRALTCKYNAQLSCGRVQTPTLTMVADRMEEIKNFKSKPYYGMKIYLDQMEYSWIDKKSGAQKTFDKKEIEAIQEKCQGKPLVVQQIEKKEKKTYPGKLYDLTELQRDANQKFDYSAKETLNIMQRLYENHKVLTYPRTDSSYLPQDVVGTIKERLEACSGGPYRKIAVVARKNPLKGKLHFVDDSRVTDHHAIIPTEQYVQLDHMTIDERRIYDLVVKRFIAALYPPYEYEQTSVTLAVAGEVFVGKTDVVKSIGFKAVYEQEKEMPESKNKSSFLEGTTIDQWNLRVTEGKTTPPSLLNEASLLASMEKKGLGTVATRADIIEKLFQSFLVEKKGKDIAVTAKGKQLLELVPRDLKKPELTASWESKLNSISEGRLSGDVFTKEMVEYAKELVEQIKTAQGSFRHENMLREKCPNCEKNLLLVKGKNSTMKVCQDRECGYRETVSKTSNARCPKCHKKLELIGKGEEQRFICNTCGHKEKLSNFKDRRKKEGAGVSKKDVNRYLQKQKNQEEPVNTAFADAFKNLKL